LSINDEQGRAIDERLTKHAIVLEGELLVCAGHCSKTGVEAAPNRHKFPAIRQCGGSQREKGKA